MKTINLEHAKKLLPIGAKVRFYPIDGDAGYEDTVVCSEPWELGSGQIVIKVEGRSGGVNVDHLWLSPSVVIGGHIPYPVHDGRKRMDGKTYLPDAKGNLVPIEAVKPQNALEDETVRKIIGYAKALSDQISRFKEHTFDDIGDFEAILAQEYDAKFGGKKGNKTLMTHDGLYKVSVQVADNIDFGPELQIAKGLLDECLTEWAADARPELRAIVTRAFNTDKAGQINRSEIFMLLRLDISDPRWVKAMKAIRDAMRIVGSKTYVRCHERSTSDGRWEPITIDLAKA